MKRASLAVLFTALAACALSTHEHDPRSQPYFAASAIPATALPVPLHPDEPGWPAQLQAVRDVQAAASGGEIDDAKSEAHVHLALLTDSLPGHPTPADHPKLFAWLKRVSATSYVETEQDKAYWHIPRPYVAAPNIARHVESLNNGSYPSGHATFAYLMASALGSVYPSAREALQARADEIAHHRLVAGVHTPQDLAAGQTLAGLVYARLQVTPEYLSDRDGVLHEQAAN